MEILVERVQFIVIVFQSIALLNVVQCAPVLLVSPGPVMSQPETCTERDLIISIFKNRVYLLVKTRELARFRTLTTRAIN